jgi:glycosyltransferase involved in cell wall biosynthesis
MLLTTLFAVAGVIQIAYWHLLGRGFDRARKDAEATLTPPRRLRRQATVVVAARNEEAVIPTLLRSLGAQDHTSLEYIVVNDASDDETAAVVSTLLPRARVIDVTAPTEPRKKNALALGIDAAETDLLLFTDADCEPPSEWASELIRHHSVSDERVVVGYSPFRKAPGFLNGFARYETFVAGFAAAAAIGAGHAYTATGRNLSYSRALFRGAGGFSDIMKSLSGDDDLMLQHLSMQPGVEVVHAFGEKTYVLSDPPTSWQDWSRQKLRHTSAGRYYRPDIKANLLAYHITNTAVWLSPLFVGWFGAAFLAARLSVQFRELRRAASVLGESDLMRAQPIYEFVYLVYNALLAPIGVMRRPRRW